MRRKISIWEEIVSLLSIPLVYAILLLAVGVRAFRIGFNSVREAARKK